MALEAAGPPAGFFLCRNPPQLGCIWHNSMTLWQLPARAGIRFS